MPLSTSRRPSSAAQLDPEIADCSAAAGGAWRSGEGGLRARFSFSAPLTRRHPPELPSSITDSCRQRGNPGEGEETGGRCLQCRVVVLGPGEEVPGAPSKEIAPESIASTRSAAAKQRSRRCSAISTVTPHSSFRRRRSQISSSPATGSNWEVGSSSSTKRGPGDQSGGERDSLQLPSRERVDGSVEQVGDREGQGDLLDRSGARRGGRSAHLQRQADLGRDRGRDDLGLGVLGDVADHGGQPAGSGGERVDAGDLDGALDLTAVEVGHEPAGGAQQRRLAAGRAAGEQDELAGADLERDVAQGRAAAWG